MQRHVRKCQKKDNNDEDILQYQQAYDAERRNRMVRGTHKSMRKERRVYFQEDGTYGTVVSFDKRDCKIKNVNTGDVNLRKRGSISMLPEPSKEDVKELIEISGATYTAVMRSSRNIHNATELKYWILNNDSCERLRVATCNWFEKRLDRVRTAEKVEKVDEDVEVARIMLGFKDDDVVSEEEEESESESEFEEEEEEDEDDQEEEEEEEEEIEEERRFLKWYEDEKNWTVQEKKAFCDGIRRYGQDFELVQKEVVTKSLRSCVSYYCRHLSKMRVNVNVEEVESDDQEIDEKRPDWLPNGWTKVQIPRSSVNGQRYDTFYFGPDGKRCRSRPDVERYMRKRKKTSAGQNNNNNRRVRRRVRRSRHLSASSKRKKGELNPREKFVSKEHHPDWLPKGWVCTVVERSAGSSGPKADMYYYEVETWKRCRSRPEVERIVREKMIRERSSSSSSFDTVGDDEAGNSSSGSLDIGSGSEEASWVWV